MQVNFENVIFAAKLSESMEKILKRVVRESVKALYNSDVSDDLIQIQETRRDVRGDFTLVVFPLLRFSKNTPEKTGEMIGNHILLTFPAISAFNVIKGFLNLEVSEKWWKEFFAGMSGSNELLAGCRSAGTHRPISSPRQWTKRGRRGVPDGSGTGS